MTTVVIMPGGFHPFHAGHYALYQQARKAFPGAEVFVAATNDTSARPFPFAVKEKLAKLAGVEPGHFVQVKSPFRAEEITSQFDPQQDTLIFVRSEKDANKPPQAGGVKKDGTPAYLQPLAGQKKLEPFSRHAYMAYLPTVEFGPGMTSATEIRTAWPGLNDRRKTALVMSLYPRTQSNPKLAATVRKMLDTAIVGLEESIPVQPVKPVVPGNNTQQQPKTPVYAPELNKKKPSPAAVIHIKEFAPDGSGDDDPMFNPETFYDIPKLKAVAKRLAQRSVNFGWYDLQLKVLIKYMSEPYIVTLDDLEKMFPTAPEIAYYIERNIIKAWPSNEPPYIIKNPNYKPRAPKSLEEIRDKHGYHTSVSKGKFLPSKYGQDENNLYLHDLMNSSHAGEGPVIVTIDDQRIATEIAAMYGGYVERTGLNTYRIYKPRGTKHTAGTPELTGVAESNPDYIEEKWSEKYKRSINCANPRGFSQRAHCAGRKK